MLKLVEIIMVIGFLLSRPSDSNGTIFYVRAMKGAIFYFAAASCGVLDPKTE